jgi:hypothetical protein
VVEPCPTSEWRHLRQRVQEEIRPEGVADHLLLDVPEVVLQITRHRVDLVIKRQIAKVAACLGPCHMETRAHQTLTQANGQLTAITRQVVNALLCA